MTTLTTTTNTNGTTTNGPRSPFWRMTPREAIGYFRLLAWASDYSGVADWDVRKAIAIALAAVGVMGEAQALQSMHDADDSLHQLNLTPDAAGRELEFFKDMVALERVAHDGRGGKIFAEVWVNVGRATGCNPRAAVQAFNLGREANGSEVPF